MEYSYIISLNKCLVYMLKWIIRACCCENGALKVNSWFPLGPQNLKILLRPNQSCRHLTLARQIAKTSHFNSQLKFLLYKKDCSLDHNRIRFCLCARPYVCVRVRARVLCVYRQRLLQKFYPSNHIYLTLSLGQSQESNHYFNVSMNPKCVM